MITPSSKRLLRVTPKHWSQCDIIVCSHLHTLQGVVEPKQGIGTFRASANRLIQRSSGLTKLGMVGRTSTLATALQAQSQRDIAPACEARAPHALGVVGSHRRCPIVAFP
eukprot:scaffold7417_cov417-Prasinococcus_capsulatus_cf.AAC.4